jgi:uncharacterized membrane protein YphA (DoxX/SURF4 family)
MLKQRGGTSMNVTLWVLQILLALVFVAHGWMLLAPPASLIDQMNASMSPAFRIFLGIAEVLAAIGLTVPGLARIQTWLVPAAAVGIMIVMVSATVWHVARNEISAALTTAVLLVMATLVAYMRWTRPIPARRPAAALPR